VSATGGRMIPGVLEGVLIVVLLLLLRLLEKGEGRLTPRLKMELSPDLGAGVDVDGDLEVKGELGRMEENISSQACPLVPLFSCVCVCVCVCVCFLALACSFSLLGHLLWGLLPVNCELLGVRW
jgi:hypothetical protein